MTLRRQKLLGLQSPPSPASDAASASSDLAEAAGQAVTSVEARP
jgi:hypothetical protein